MLSDLLFRLHALARRRSLDAELDAELRDHLDRQADKHVAAGLSRGDAIRRARLEFGGLTQTAEACREARGISLRRDDRPRRALRRARAAERRGVHGHRAPHARPRHRRDDHRLQRRPRDSAQAAAIRRRGPDRAAVAPGAARRQSRLHEIPWGRTDFHAEEASTRAFSALRRVPRRFLQPDRRGRARAARRAARLGRVLPVARRRAGARALVHAG